MTALLINDVHLGVVRTAGTTRESQGQIQDYVMIAFRDLIMDHINRGLIINGDLFDGFDVDAGQLLQAYFILYEWLTKSVIYPLDLVQGNHDIAKNSLRTSSFAMLCQLLAKSFPDRVHIHNEGLAPVGGNVWVIPHVVNQDRFDVELEKALDQVPKDGFLLLHANVDNKFAVEADHSLNVSDAWLRKLTKAGMTLVFAHEHQARTLMGGQVIVLGNQWPTSIADCMAHGAAQKDGCKYAHVFEDGLLKPIKTWEAEGDYVTMPWNELQETGARFIKITGKVEADLASDVITAISKYRQQSKAFVITNSVEVAGIAGIGDMAGLSVEKLQALNVLDALCDELTPEEALKVRELLVEEDAR